MIAAGGTGRTAWGIAAAQALGAQAAQMGTAFWRALNPASPRVPAGPGQAQDTDTRLTRVFSGRPARALSTR